MLSLLINVGMWSERFTIIVLSLQREYLPSTWHSYSPTWSTGGSSAGPSGFFSLLFMLFLRWVPFIPTSEVARAEPRARARAAAGGGVKRRSGLPLGLVAEFASPEQLLGAIARMRDRGYASSTPSSRIRSRGWRQRSTFAARGSTGWRFRPGCSVPASPSGCSGLVNACLYPLNVGGRPSFAIPAFIIITFETMVLFAGVTAFVSLFWVCRLPRLSASAVRCRGVRDGDARRLLAGRQRRRPHLRSGSHRGPAGGARRVAGRDGQGARVSAHRVSARHRSSPWASEPARACCPSPTSSGC